MINRPRRVTFLTLLMPLLAVTQHPAAQDHAIADEALRQLLEGAFSVHISARIFDQHDNETVWNMDLSRVTISGRSVKVRLDGSNIVVEAEFTPFWAENDQLMLVADGQTWVTGDSLQEEAEHRTAFQTLPIQLGEPVTFFPLGASNLPVDTDRYGRLNIELKINVERYQS